MAGYCELIWRKDGGEAVASMEFDDTQFWLAPQAPPFWQITLNPSGAQKDQLFSERWQSLIGYRTAAETAPSLPETPYNLPDADLWRAMHGAPRDGTEVRVRLRPLDVRAYWDEELRVFVLSRPVHIESIVDAFGWKPLLTASPSLSPETP